MKEAVRRPRRAAGRLLLGASLWAVAAGCGAGANSDARAGNEVAPTPPMEGAWRWVGSAGGHLDGNVTPGSSGRGYTIEFMPGDRYRETSSAEGMAEGSYTLTKGGTFQQPSISFLILRVPRPLFRDYFGPEEEYAVVVRGDTLVLSEASSHPWVHRFVRVAR